MMRWMCRTVTGTHRFDFHASGWSILWRTLAFGFGSIFLLPMPWLLRWFTAWFISEIEVADARA
jgi:hypothetical protein